MRTSLSPGSTGSAPPGRDAADGRSTENARPDGRLTLRPLRGAAVAQQIDIAHTGNQDGVTFKPPLTRQWTVDLGGAVSYPLIVEERVFVVSRVGDRSGVRLHALDVRTGKPSWGPLELGGMCHAASAAYDAGKVFVRHCSGTLSAFDAASGKMIWSIQHPGVHEFTSVPTAAGGYVFVQGAGVGAAVIAVDGETGAVRWESPDMAGSGFGAPAIAEDAVYVAQSCGKAYRLEPLTGLLVWHHPSKCGGAGGLTSPLHQGTFYARASKHEPGVVLHSRTGGGEVPFPPHALPALDSDLGFFVDWPSFPSRADVALRAIALATNTTLWTFAGDDQLGPAPIVANHHVYVASRQGQLYALDETTGAVLWSDALGSPVSDSDQEDGSNPPTGLAAGSEMLIVAAGRTLIGYR
jgi:outer membrane protein assembly factor BamB